MENRKFNFDYTKCMMMKILLATPKKSGKGCDVVNTFADALQIIKEVDAITLGAPKIIYLVGWQYNGHNDKYPDFFEVNEALKLPNKSARDSLVWLMQEAKKYNTTVSVHINFNDAYPDAPSFESFLQANALIRNKRGKNVIIEAHGGRKCYKISFVEYWESGLFKQYFDRLLALLPLQAQGTIHVDDFQCYHNYCPDISIKEMQAARRKMIDYVYSKGIDITSEFTYREDETLKNKQLPGFERNHNKNAPMDTLGIIPATWWCSNMTREEYVSISPQQYCGGIYRDGKYANYLYSNIHGENIFSKYNKGPSWIKEFVYSFATEQLPFWFLCNYKRKKIIGNGNDEYCEFENGVVSYNKNRKITVNGVTVKENDNLCLPVPHLKNTYIAYSKYGIKKQWQLLDANYRKAQISRFETDKFVFLQEKRVENGRLELKLQPNEAVKIVLK